MTDNKVSLFFLLVVYYRNQLVQSYSDYDKDWTKGSLLAVAQLGPTLFNGYWQGLSLGIKWPGHEAHYSPPFSALSAFKY